MVLSALQAESAGNGSFCDAAACRSLFKAPPVMLNACRSRTTGTTCLGSPTCAP